MIVRSWKATARDATAYVAHFRRRVLPRLVQLRGFHGALVLSCRAPGASADIEVLTFWSSIRSIRRFAGEETDLAVVDDDVRSLVKTFDRRARHFNVVLDTRRRRNPVKH